MRKKTSLSYDHEVDLIDLFKVIWVDKIKVILITTISFLIGIGTSYLIPQNYSNSLAIKVSNNYDFLNNEFESTLYTSEIILNKFITELQDYEEFLTNFNNTKKIREKISKLPLENQQKELLKYKKLLEITSQSNLIILNFKWDNINEATDILQNTVNLAYDNLEKSIYKESKNVLINQKELALKNDNKRLQFLKEHRWIAKELGISDNQITILGQDFKYHPLYYLIGYRAIDKQIDVIENRNYYKYDLIEQKIISLKKKNIKFIKFDIRSIEVKSLINTKLILVTSVFLGLFVSLCYVVISHLYHSKIISKKRY